MMRSLSSAVGGLRAHQTKMDVIGNNIANVNTYGFKSSRVTFSDVYYQTLSGGSRPTTALGGTNPTQIGYGAAVATIDVLNSPSGMASTDRALDVYINGDGMITTQDANGNLFYSRLGVLGFDAEGNLVDSSGNFVMGFPMDANGNPIINPDGSLDPENLSRIQVKPEMLDQMTGISIGPTGEIIGTMPGDNTMNASKSVPPWLTGVTLSEDSNLSGKINVTMDIISKTSGALNNAPWITSVTPAKNSRIDGLYNFDYDHTTKKITASGPNGEVYTGDYKRGELVDLKDATGKVMFTVQTEQYIVPSATGALGSIAYNAVLELNMTAQDAGGNKVTAGPIEYDGYSTTVVFNDDVSITIDPSKVGLESVPKMSYDITNSYNTWLKTMVADDNAVYTEGDIYLRATKEYMAKIVLGAGYEASKFLDEDQLAKAVEAAVNAWPGTNDYEGIKVTWEEQVPAGSNNYILKITSKDGLQTTSSSVFSSAAPLSAANRITIGGTDIQKNGVTFAGGNNTSGETIGSCKVYDHIYMYDKGFVQLGNPVVFKEGQSLYKMGDGGMNTLVDADALKAYFGAIATPSLSTNPPSTAPSPSALYVNVGSFNIEQQEDWMFNNSIGMATPGEGEKVTIGVIALANVPNLAGMLEAGDSYFTVGPNSGDATYSRPGINGAGSLKAGYLEMSNVDISKEFTDMITTQRGFQANTRIITVSDEMLQELVNLKR